MKYLFLLLAMLWFSPLIARNNNTMKEQPYQKEWTEVDSLLDNGVPKSAEKKIMDIYRKAKTANQSVQMMKAQMYLLRTIEYAENSDSEIIRKAETQLKGAVYPYDLIWHSIVAQLYNNYYDQHRWQLYSRTTLADTKTDNLKEWDAAQFHKVIAGHYLKSIDEKTRTTSLSAYEAILTEGENTRALRPTLYDLLSFRALAYFQNDERDLQQPAFRFDLNDPAFIAPADQFLAKKIVSADTASLQWRALLIYQQLLSFHKNDPQPDAFIDADLARLQFAYNASTVRNKKALYEQTLKSIIDKNPDNKIAASARYFLVASIISEAKIDAYDESEEKEDGKKVDLAAARVTLQSIIAKFPETEAANNAQMLLNRIDWKLCTIAAEETSLPKTASRLLVRYKNVSHAYFKVVKLDEKYFQSLLQSNYDTFYKQVFKSPAVQTFDVALPGTADYKSHSTEVKVNALPMGAYAVIVSTKADFSKEDNALSYALFQVTDLAMVQVSGHTKPDYSGYILRRGSGEAVPNANIQFYHQKYNDKTHQYDFIQAFSTQSGADGSLAFKEKNASYNGYRIKSDDDTYYSQEYFSSYKDRHGKPVPEMKAFFFTDRSIYRPGQTVYFKAIVMQASGDKRTNAVVANFKTTVRFYDANAQVVATKDLVTNEYGSVTGSFVAPASGLTGNMSLSNDLGSVSFSVEEYKRPKFAVSFDTLKGHYSLNETATVKGFAKGYAGNNIDGAKVKYTVKRQARWPFWYDWWRPMPYSSEQEIAHGETTTNADGSFDVSFTTLPDATIDPESLPVFNYSIHVDITDGSGETRSGDQSLRAGYNSVVIKATVPAQATLADLSTVNVQTTNLNDVFTASKVNISVHKLVEPGFLPRARIWPMPDQFVMDEASFRKDFPTDEYKRESKPQAWKKGERVWQTDMTTGRDGKVTIPAGTFKSNGWYCVAVSTKDKSGREVKQQYYVQLYDDGLKGMPVTALSVVGNKEAYEPGDNAHLKLISTFGTANLIQGYTDMTYESLLSNVAVRDGIYNWKKTIVQDDRGGLRFSWFMVRNNRVYQSSADVIVPWTDKDLQISWATHRDKLQPGAKDRWTMTISGAKKDKVAAEMMAGMYDASLDAFRPHGWNMFSVWPQNYYGVMMHANTGFRQVNGIAVGYFQPLGTIGYTKAYDELIALKRGYGVLRNFAFDSKYANGGTMKRGEYVAEERLQANEMAAPAPATMKEVALGGGRASSTQYVVDGMQLQPNQTFGTVEERLLKASEDIPLRKNLQETAFFFPQLKTDDAGNISFEFTMPEALTEWKLMTFAHTKDMKTGAMTGTVKTQKDLMVQPNLPRFFRQGDELIITTKITNLSDGNLNGTAVLDIVDAQTSQSLNLPFRIKENKTTFTVAKGLSTTATWSVHIPESRYEPVMVRISARAGNFSDGEENMLPVLTNRTLVTETLPLWMNGTGSKTFTFDKLLHSDTSKTLAQHRVTVEYTGNPAWYAVQALPYLMEYPYECAEQTFNRFYANALAAHILDKAPKVKAIFEQWKTIDTAALQSNLEKNQELKTALLEETPWVLEAQNENKQKHNIALLFDSYKLGKSQDASLKKLEEMLLAEGGFPWFKGSIPDRYITQYIATGIARLKHLGINNKRADQLLDRMLPYLDRKVEADYKELVKSKAKLDEQHISYTHIQYLYLRSFSGKNVPNTTAFNYYKQQAAKYWSQNNPYMKAMIALSLHRMGDQKMVPNVLASLKETSLRSEEMGMYWKQSNEGYWWYEAPIERQAMMIECFSEATKDEATVDELRRWLLKQKQTQNWKTTKATADACYALLLKGTEWLSNTPDITISLGDKTVSATKQETGTGYLKQVIEGKDVRPAMGHVTVTSTSQLVDQATNFPSYGAVYWQYFEQFDKITSAKTPLALKKQLFIERNTDRGAVLEEIKEGKELKVGDKVKVRIVLQSDRAMEYLHLKDMRAACFEPTNVLSGYRYQGGLGYYESTRDASSNFFISYLNKGTYVFEYSVNVMAKGTFSNGISTIQCMYAPEFTSHSEGIMVKVK